jgi:hypothetical protein
MYSRQDSLDGGSARRKAATYKQNNTNTEETHTDVDGSSGIRTHDPSVRVGEEVSCLRSLDRCDRLFLILSNKYIFHSETAFAYN